MALTTELPTPSAGIRTLQRFIGADVLPGGPARSGTGAPLLTDDAVARRVHDDPAMVAGGLRAVLLQLMHPLLTAGLVDHATDGRDPLWRLAAQLGVIEAYVYGDEEDLDGVLAQMREAHTPVHGIAPDGRRYDATDPHLLGWVHAVLVDSFVRAADRFGPRLDPVEADAYVAELAELGERLGAEAPARSVATLRQQLREQRSELMPSPQARAEAHRLFAADVAAPMRPAYTVVLAAAVAMLPRSVRRELWIPVAPLAEPLLIRPAATVTIRLLGFAPRLPFC